MPVKTLKNISKQEKPNEKMNNKHYTIKKTNLYEQIADCLENEIIHSGTKIVKLPSEKELAIQFSVSKTAIREALKVLKERGLIASKNGEGSFVTKPDMTSIANSLNRIVKLEKIDDMDLHEMRMILESTSARKAALHADAAEIQKMEELIDKVSEKDKFSEDRVDLDSQFHIIVAKAGKNPILGLFAEVLTRQLRDFMIKGASQVDMNKNYLEHRRIVEAIKEKNPDKAEKAMQNHLKVAWKNIEKYRGIHAPKNQTVSKF